jgi:hypothetical protein
MRIAILLASLGGASGSGLAQPAPPDGGAQPPPPAEREPEIPADAFGRETPRGSVAGFFAAAEEGDFERAAEYVDLRFLPLEHRGTTPDILAHKLSLCSRGRCGSISGPLANGRKGSRATDCPSPATSSGASTATIATSS